MNTLKHIYNIGVAGALLTSLVACSTELTEEGNLTPGTTPIQLAGVVTRANGDGNSNLNGHSGLYLSAKVTDSPETSFFSNIQVTGITTSAGDANKSDLETTVYYPLNATTQISLYGHTGEVTDDGKMELTAGTEAANDALISNGTDGKGTAGSADNTVKLLTFRHVMTKLEVAIDATDNDLQETKPTNIQIGFGNKVPKNGTYDITTNPTDDSQNKATGTAGGNYTLNVGTHYLVPTGETLSGTGIIKSLKIDDYTATTADLAALEIPQAETNGVKSDLVLKPGLAYKLTFKIKRLKVVGIQLTVDDWDIETPTPEWGYDPYTMKLAFAASGGSTYSASGDNQITQVVLHHEVVGSTTDYQYIGKGSYTDGTTTIKFLSLPKTLDASSTLTIDAYTEYGLLVHEQEVTYDTSTENKGTITLTLASNGMTTKEDAYQITTPLQFYNLLKNPEANAKYQITQDIDMDALSGMPDAELMEFPSGCKLTAGTVTYGNSVTRPHTILHLNRPLFSKNNGTISGLYIFSGSISGSGDCIGSICNENEGIIAGCVNEAEIKGNATAVGGICGKNSGTILACLNTGNIGSGTTVGGICGENASTTEGAIKACINTGMLNKSATNLGGICGSTATTSNKVVNTCYWLTGTARKDQAVNNEVAIGNDTNNSYCDNASDLAPERLRTETIEKLNTAAAETWKFALQKEVCVWPMPLLAKTD